MMLEEPRSIIILQILLILSKNPLLWNFHTWWRTQFMKTSVTTRLDLNNPPTQTASGFPEAVDANCEFTALML
jgi:hypothetical protein